MRRLMLIGALLAGGCATPGRVGTATMEADPTLIGAEGLALQAQLSLAYTRSPPDAVDGRSRPIENAGLCRYLLPSFQERGAYPYARHDDQAARRGGNAAAQFECLYLVQNPTQEQVDRHVEAGFALSDLYCEIYFRRIARRWNERVFLRNTTNDVGAAISAVLGLTAAGSGVTGGVGAAFGLADSLFRNYDDVFVVSPDLPTMQNLVRIYQNQLRTRIAGSERPTTYYRAQSYILEYARYCSYTGMRGLLNGAIDRTVAQLRADAEDAPPRIDRTLGNSPVGAAAVAAATRQETINANIAEQRTAELRRQREAIEAGRTEEARIANLSGGNQVQPEDQ